MFLLGTLLFLLAACTTPPDGTVDSVGTPEAVEGSPLATHPPLDPTYVAQIAEMRSPDVPDLPFPDNPDPSQCGIPTRWGDDNRAWLTGFYKEELIQPTVLLYDSHLRFHITAGAPHGSEVEVILYQQNPVTDYYLVKIVGAETPNQGWIPAPFLTFEPPEEKGE